MNYHTDDYVMEQVNAHLDEASEYFKEKSVVGIFLQGSQNYGLDYQGSDVDTKLIVCPTFAQIAFNKKPISTTHVRANNEHIDFKDVRFYIGEFRKQNINFLEILFTDYAWINPDYEWAWNKLIRHRERIARYDPYRAVKAMKGMAHEKYTQMEKSMPHNCEIVAELGYEPKQLSHILRLEEFIERYIAGISFADCMKTKRHELLMKAKTGGFTHEEAVQIAIDSLEHIDEMCKIFSEENEPGTDEWVDTLLDEVQADIIRKCLKSELLGEWYD